MQANDQTVDLLYIEDNEDFIEFVGMALKKVGRNISYGYVTDAEKATELLAREQNNPYKKAKLILLDYNLAGVSGIDLLKKIRSDSDIKHVPVVVFSSSDNPKDIKDAYQYGANAYLVKPVGIANLKDTMQTVCDFWISRNQLCS